jgi:ATP-dependent exoDNAse (exonuclease V) beta subunit
MCSIYDNNINNLKLINTLPYIKRTFRSYALLKDIYDKVEEVSSQEGVMLLDQTKSILSRFVSGNDAPFIYEKIGNRFERFMIDEFQDTSAREWKNFVPLLRNAISQAEDEVVLIVGDVKQSIYRWRGGDWRILSEGVEQALGKENIFPDKLKDNWRSLPQIVTFNNDMMRDIVTKDNEALNTELKNAVQQGQLSSKAEAELKGTLDNAYKNLEQTPKKDGDDKGYVRIEYYNSKEDIPLIKCIEAAIARGYSYKDILILCRSNETIKKVAEILLQYKQTNKPNLHYIALKAYSQFLV